MTLGDRLVVMSDGVVQQCAPPAEVYARPANRFVAGFVGTPTMNFVEGTVEGGRFRCDAGEVELGGRYPDGPLVLGVRPDKVALVAEGAGLAARVHLSEHLGDRTDVRLDLGRDLAWTARVEDTDAEAGDAIGLAIAAADTHAFDVATGARIEPR